MHFQSVILEVVSHRPDVDNKLSCNHHCHTTEASNSQESNIIIF